MQIQKDKRYAVLTGDLIRSSTLDPESRQLALTEISSIALDLENYFLPLSIVGPEFFRGDGWQLFISDPKVSLKVAFYFRARLRAKFKCDSRISIGIGTVEQMPAQKLSKASGNAFQFSGKGLDLLKRNENMICWLKEPSHYGANRKLDALELNNLFINAALRFASRLADQWTQPEAWTVFKSLEGKTQSDIANEWIDSDHSTTQQNVAKTLNRTGWNELESYLILFEDYSKSIQPI